MGKEERIWWEMWVMEQEKGCRGGVLGTSVRLKTRRSSAEKAFPHCQIARMAVPDVPYRDMKRAFPQGEKARSAAQERR